MPEEFSPQEVNLKCPLCGNNLPSGAAYCPTCGTITPSRVASFGVSPHEPTVASSYSSVPQYKPATGYGSPPYGVPLQNPYEPYNPYEAPLRPPPPPSSRRQVKIGLLIGIIVLVLVLVSGGEFVFLRQTSLPATTTATVTAQLGRTAQPSGTTPTPATPQELYNQATSGNPALVDPLTGQDANNWDTISTPQASCAFIGNAYHISIQQQNAYQPCFAEATNFSNFAVQVEMTMLKGDGGVLLFRAGGAEPYGYRFGLTRDYFDLVYGTKRLISSSNITTNLNQTYVLTVIARGSSLSLYKDKQWITTAEDNSTSSGTLGFAALDFSNNAEVVFRNLQVWTL